jgi:hypothetical protein
VSSSTVPLFQHAGADALFDVLARAYLEYDRVDPFQVQKVRKNQPGGTSPNDANLCAFGHTVRVRYLR